MALYDELKAQILRYPASCINFYSSTRSPRST